MIVANPNSTKIFNTIKFWVHCIYFYIYLYIFRPSPLCLLNNDNRIIIVDNVPKPTQALLRAQSSFKKWLYNICVIKWIGASKTVDHGLKSQCRFQHWPMVFSISIVNIENIGLKFADIMRSILYWILPQDPINIVYMYQKYLKPYPRRNCRYILSSAWGLNSNSPMYLSAHLLLIVIFISCWLEGLESFGSGGTP